LWLKGFQEGLRVESAIVATTDKRQSVVRFASSLGIAVLDGEAVQRLVDTQKLANNSRLSNEEFIALVDDVDASRSSKEWRNKLDAAKSGLASHLGFLSANESLDAARFFLEAALLVSEPGRSTAMRSFLICASYAAVSLDFAMKDLAFHSVGARHEAIVLGLRFGEGTNSSTLDAVRLSLELARQYLDNGSAAARQIETSFFEHAQSIPAEIVAEFVSKVAATDNLFRVARELDERAYGGSGCAYDQLSLDAKSFLGITSDYLKMSRKKANGLFPIRAVRQDLSKGQMSPSDVAEMLPLEEPKPARS
jgi:hypothetical protein